MSFIVKIFLQLLGIDHSLSDDSVIVCRFCCTRKLNDTVIFWRHSKIIKYSTIFFTETLCCLEFFNQPYSFRSFYELVLKVITFYLFQRHSFPWFERGFRTFFFMNVIIAWQNCYELIKVSDLFKSNINNHVKFLKWN
jgi:hypothetical protein